MLNQADEAILDTGTLEEILAGAGVTKALELVGPKTLRDTLRCVRKGGTVCNTGILGGVFTLNGFDPIKEIPNGVYFTGFFSNYPDQKTMKDIFSFISRYLIKPNVGAVYPFEKISEALWNMEHHRINGKIVVRL